MNMFNLSKLLNRIYTARLPELKDLEQVLSLNDPKQLNVLFSFADTVRKEFCGDGILLRGIIEFSSYCSRECFYCGLHKSNHKLKRYRMSEDELFKAVEYLASCRIKTLVLQSGQDDSLDALWFKDIISKIKSKFDMAVTLSLGEKSMDEYGVWRQAGADRYLLKIETFDKELYESVHSGMSLDNRIKCLNYLRALGYQLGSGNIIGLPGQTLKMIAQDIIFFKRGDFDMIGIGPFIPHQDTAFANRQKGEVNLCLKAIALTRIVTKNAHIPATTALGSMDKDYRFDGLKCGANVLMPNFTPQPYRKLYEIYPGKRCVDEPVGRCSFCMDNMAKEIGRFIDYSRGDSLKERKVSANV
ncbi:MAG: [FeFe] hydrogenase H-cluster radical SAM maturase HydE [Candidatus Omnitrophica bacterium]|jgi:biotin synthase|nr:[FeFe] hydrogenase H-cluster radical SAM maturase HydE [Candidatus Omnitrophota bacterium]MDD5661279.1 [FeFe] hydrogenase H-cluster radical SAM maturase HydE [Candidatus Omnitrophota bacterium]